MLNSIMELAEENIHSLDGQAEPGTHNISTSVHDDCGTSLRSVHGMEQSVIKIEPATCLGSDAAETVVHVIVKTESDSEVINKVKSETSQDIKVEGDIMGNLIIESSSENSRNFDQPNAIAIEPFTDEQSHDSNMNIVMSEETKVLKNHLTRANSNDENLKTKRKQSEQSQMPCSKRPRAAPFSYHCKLCRENYILKKEFVRHIFNMHWDFTCKFCAKVQNGKNSLKTHIEDKHTRIICPVCFLNVDRSCDQSHSETHFSPTAYKCSEAYLCPLCTYTSISKSQFIYHMRALHIYGSRDMMQCPVCKSNQSSLDVLMQHIIKAHLDPKPLKCPMCCHGAATRSAHIKHVKSHMIKICDMCNREPMHVSGDNVVEWNEHIADHVSECSVVPVCPLCSIRVTNHNALKSHISMDYCWDNVAHNTNICDLRQDASQDRLLLSGDVELNPGPRVKILFKFLYNFM